MFIKIRRKHRKELKRLQKIDKTKMGKFEKKMHKRDEKIAKHNTIKFNHFVKNMRANDFFDADLYQ